MQLIKIFICFTAGLLTIMIGIMANIVDQRFINTAQTYRSGGYQQLGAGQIASDILCQNSGILIKADRPVIQKILQSEPYRDSG